MIGAPLLAARAALRSGAGVVTLASSQYVIDKLANQVTESLVLSLAYDDPGVLHKVLSYANERHVSVVLIGPGLSVDSATSVFTQSIIESLPFPIIIDGGGLTAVSKKSEVLTTAKSKSVILTPHTGELSRLVGHSLPKQRDQIEPIARQFAQAHRVTLLVKGQFSFIVQAGQKTYKNKTGNPGLATAGTGDVLAGMIGAMLCQQFDVFTSTVAATYLHGLAADLAVAAKTQPGLIASDVIDFIPAALCSIQKSL